MKPSRDEMRVALEEAVCMRDEHYDACFMAKSLLYLAEKDRITNRVMEKLRVYIKAGMATSDMAHLLKVVNEWEAFHRLEDSVGENQEDERHL